MNKSWQITLKEWGEVFKNKIVLYVVGLMPILFTILPLVILSQMAGSGDVVDAMGSMEEIPANMSALCEGVSGTVCSQYIIVSQFLLLFLIMPVMIPATIASYSIVGEKATKTLEPLLATPITTTELLIGKALAAVIPAVIVTWIAFGVFVGGTAIIMDGTELVSLILSPMWLVLIFVVAPLLSILGVSFAVMVSSRVNDPRIAEQVSTLLILPLLALFMGQTFGLIQMNFNITLWIAALMFVLDAILLYIATQLFQREKILTKWK
jgi:ABC-2 type transport system permease protein